MKVGATIMGGEEERKKKGKQSKDKWMEESKDKWKVKIKIE